MARVVGGGELEIGADTSKVDADITGAAPGIGKKAGGVLSNAIGVALGIGLAKAVDAVGRGISKTLGTAFTEGFKRLNSIDQATAKLNGLGHSAESVQAIMDSALASVKGTAFGLGDAATIAASAVAAGIKPGKELTRTLSLTADTATIAGTSLNEMGGIFGKVAASGRVTNEEISQLQTRGVPALQFLADTLGVTTSEAAKMASEGKISFAQFQDAMEKGLGGAALSSGDTFVGALANVRAALGRLGAQMLGPSFKQFPDFFKQLIPIIDSAGGGAERFGEVLGGVTEKILAGVLRMVKGFTGLRDLIVNGDFSGALREAFGWEEDSRIVTFLLGVRDTFGRVVDYVKANSGWLGPVVAGLTGLGGALGIIGKVASLVGPLGGMAGAMALLGGKVKALLGPLRLLWGVLAANPILLVLSVIAGLVAAFVAAEKSGTNLGEVFAGVGEKIAAFAGQLPGMVEGLLSALPGIIQTVVQTIADVVPKIVSALSSTLPAIITSIVSIITTLVPALVQVLTSMVPVLVQAAVQLLSALVQAIPQVIPPLIAGIVQLITMLVGLLPTLIPMVLQAAITLFTSIVQALVTILPTVIEGIVQLVTGLITALVGMIPVLLDGAVQLLMAIIEAIPVILPILIEGIVELVMMVVETLPTLITTLLEAAVELLMAIVEAVPIIIPALITAGINLIMALVKMLPTLIPTLLQAQLTLITTLVKAIPMILGALLSAGRDLIMSLVRMLPSLGSTLMSTAKDLWAKIAEAVPKILSQLNAAVYDLITKAVDRLKGFAGRFVSAGRDLIAGVARGVRNGASAVWEAVKNAAKNALDNVKNFLGISSPSKVFEVQVGEPTGQGWLKGLENMERDIVAKNNAIAKASVPTIPRTRLPRRTPEQVHEQALAAKLAAARAGATTHVTFEAGAITLSLEDLEQLEALEDFIELLQVRRRMG